MRLAIRVIFGDTDQMGVVYYANYLRYFEAARGAFLRERGGSYRELEAEGYALPVIEAHVEYKRPAKYDDVIEIEPVVAEVRGASLRFTYTITRAAAGGASELLAEGYTVHACLGKNGRPARFPPALVRLLAASSGI